MPPGSRSLQGEFALIRSLQRRFAPPDARIVRGIGEDTAVIKSSGKEWTLLTTDLLAEGVHFNPATSSFADIGYRAAIANLSDIASMGGTPQYLLVAMAIPSSMISADIHQLYRGMMEACRPFGVKLVGGDTSASRQGLFLNVTLTGAVEANRPLRRDTARAGDFLYVTGTLGDSYAGLQLLQAVPRRKRQAGSHMDRAHARFLATRHHRPSARLEEGRWLVTHRLATAAIDLSDGLAGDLRHLCEQSRVGAELFLSELPLSKPCLEFSRAHHVDPFTIALVGGEDYELLFTVAARNRSQFEAQAGHTRHRFTCIGIVRPRSFGLRIRTIDGALRPLALTSYEHFRPPVHHRTSP